MNSLNLASIFLKKTYLVLFAILIFGFFLRVFLVNQVSLYGDELTLVYDSYSLLKTGGYDQTGQFLPLTFSMGAGRPAGYVYLTIPFVALFGPTEFGVRSLSILSGLGLIICLFFLGKFLLSEKLGLIAAFLLAVSPWDINLSRGGFEAHLALFLSILGILSFLYAIKRPWLYLLSALSFGLAVHTYPTYKLTLPIFLIVLIWFSGGFKSLFAKRNLLFVSSAFFILIFVAFLAVNQTLYNGSEARFFSINLFSQESTKQIILQNINQERNLDNLSQSWSKYFHNQTSEYFFLVLDSYFKNLSWDFLFLHGDGNPRHNMTNSGELYFVEFLTLILGIVYLLSKRLKKVIILILSWILIGPAATSLLGDTHALRSSFLLPPLILLSAFGVMELYQHPKSLFFEALKWFVVIGFIIQSLFIFEKLYFLSANKYSSFWSYPAKMATDIINKEKKNYNYIIVSDKIDNIEFSYPAYSQIDPQLVIAQNKNRSLLNNFKFKKFDNVYIGAIPDSLTQQFLNNLPAPVLYVGLPTDQQFLENYEFLNGVDKKEDLILEKKLN